MIQEIQRFLEADLERFLARARKKTPQSASPRRGGAEVEEEQGGGE